MKAIDGKNMLQVILIDDEKNGLNALASLVSKYVPQANIVAKCNSAKEGVEAIHQLNADDKNLVFLDIEMPYQNGFEMLEQVKEIEFEVIFTTAFQQYAIKAFKYNAADYLLKPIDPSDLQAAVQRIEQRFATKEKGTVKKLLSNLEQSMNEETDRIALHTAEGIELISPMQIVRCEAQQSYTLFILADKSRILISKNIGEIETILPSNIFMRVHKSHIINVRFIKKYMRSDGGQLLMTDGELVDISRFKKEEILSRLNLRSL